MKSRTVLIMGITAALCMALPVMAQAPAAKTTDDSKSSHAKREASATAAAPTERDIADARAKGMVWVNTNTKVYHKDGEFYGKTKKGKFMTEDDAKKAGNRMAKEPVAKKTKTDVKK